MKTILISLLLSAIGCSMIDNTEANIIYRSAVSHSKMMNNTRYKVYEVPDDFREQFESVVAKTLGEPVPAEFWDWVEVRKVDRLMVQDNGWYGVSYCSAAYVKIACNELISHELLHSLDCFNYFNGSLHDFLKSYAVEHVKDKPNVFEVRAYTIGSVFMGTGDIW